MGGMGLVGGVHGNCWDVQLGGGFGGGGVHMRPIM